MSSATILLVDDDEALLEVLAQFLSRGGYTVKTAHSYAAATESFAHGPPDIVVLDVMMPGIDGWGVIQFIRERSTVPVIMLTARSDEPDVLRGFELGADDYIGKPFSFAQLEARVRAVLARAGRDPRGDTRRLVADDLEVDLDFHRVRRGGVVIKLTPTEFRLLATLMEHPGRVFSSQQLVATVWGHEYQDEVGYIRRYIWHLRQKLEPDPDAPRYIHNERSVGYYFATRPSE